jgi:opacity protein-like surface antigen
MKRRVLTVVLTLVMASMAFSQGVDFGAHANFTISNIPPPEITGGEALKDAYGLGLGGGVHLDVSLIAFSFRFSGDYIHFAVDEEKFREAYRPLFGNAVNQMNIEGGALGIYSISANGKLNILPIPVLTPYITGGIGLAWLNRDEAKTSISGTPGATVPASSSSGETMVNIGAGADFKLGVKLFAEIKYCLIFTEGTNSTYVPITVGITF